MKAYFHFLCVAAVYLTACTGNHWRTYTVENEYSISVPRDLVEQNAYPDRYSFSYINKDNTLNVTVKSDSKAQHERYSRLDKSWYKYPYTLKGFDDFFLYDVKQRWPNFKEIRYKETTINQMPAIINEIQFENEHIPTYVYVACVQGHNKLYRIMVLSQKVSITNADSILYSFRLIK